LLSRAIGDALGWSVEFMKLNEITHQYGPDGIYDLEISKSGKAEITDDTQMTLFTAEGILRAQTRGHLKGICHEPGDNVFYNGKVSSMPASFNLDEPVAAGASLKIVALLDWWNTPDDNKAQGDTMIIDFTFELKQ